MRQIARRNEYFLWNSIDSQRELCYNFPGSFEPGAARNGGRSASCLQGVQILFHPLPLGKGVAEMTQSELYEFCLVLISLADLIIHIIQINKKK